MARIKTTFLILFSSTLAIPSGDMLANAAKYDKGWIANGREVEVNPGSYDGVQDWSFPHSIVTAMKAAGLPFCGLYVGGPVFGRQFEPQYPAMTTATQMLAPDGTPLVYGPFGSTVYRWPNLWHDGVRQALIDNYLAFCDENDFDGVMFDSWSPAYHAQQIALAPTTGMFDLPGGSQEGPTHQTSAWQDIMGAWTLELKAALAATGRDLYINGLGYTVDAPSDPAWVFMGSSQTNTADYATGVLNELSTYAYVTVAYFTQTLDMVRRATAKGGEVFFSVSPEFLTLLSAIEFDWGPEIQRYFLVTYLLVQNDLTYYSYYRHGAYIGYAGPPTISITGGSGAGATASLTVAANGQIESLTLTAGGTGYVTTPTVSIVGGGGTRATAAATIGAGAVTAVTLTNAGSGYFTGAVYVPYVHWEDDWDLDFGEPTGIAYQTSPETYVWRQYTRGYAIVNPQSATVHLFDRPGSYRAWDADDGPIITVTNDPTTFYPVPPRTGVYLFHAQGVAA